jgi:hypothetical protein
VAAVTVSVSVVEKRIGSTYADHPVSSVDDPLSSSIESKMPMTRICPDRTWDENHTQISYEENERIGMITHRS